MNVLNLRSREVPVDAEESGALLDTLASRADRALAVRKAKSEAIAVLEDVKRDTDRLK